MKDEKIHCSIGVMAFNEELNIGRLLDALLSQSLKHVVIDEIIVVSSGSTDGTDKIVLEYADKHDKVRLIVQDERQGKASAVNLFIQSAKNDILIIESADTIPAKNTVEKLITPFRNERIGMTGGRPMPVNSGDDLVSFAVRLLWKLHHEMAVFKPKLGEMVAIRRVFEAIPEQSAVDEASIEALITRAGLDCLYVSDAVVHNKGAETIDDFIKQRKRIAIGHLWLKENHGYEVTSNNICLLFGLFIKECITQPHNIWKIIMTAKLEMYCRIVGFIEYRFHGANPFIWDVCRTTKTIDN